MSLNSIIRDLKSLDGEDCSNNYVSALKVCNNLKQFEANSYWTKKIVNLIENDVDCEELIEVNCGNSYNWGGNIDHNFDYREYNYNNRHFMAIKFHRYGDIRGNYTDYAILEYNDDDYWIWESMLECEINEIVTINDKNYYYSVSAMSDCIDIYDNEGECVTTLFDPSTIEEDLTNYLDI